MPMYNLLEYSKYYSKATGSLWNYYKDDPNNPPRNNYNADRVTNSASFKYKTSITVKTSNATLENGANTEQKNTKIKKNNDIIVPLKYSSNFWKNLDIPLINCEVSLILTWSENCVLTGIKTQTTRGTRVATNAPTNTTFKRSEVKLYVPFVTLSTENDKTLLEQLRTGFKRTIKWNKYKSEMTNQTKNNNLYYLIDSTFTKVLRLFVLSFENENYRTSLQVLCTKCPNKRL